MASPHGNGRPRTSREPAEIRAAIESAREQVACSALVLRREVSEATDWHRWFARRPALFIGLALAAGIYLGTAARRRRVRGG